MTERLKKHGKWIFVLLAVIFAMSFVLGSVGSAGGLSFLDYFSNRQQQQDVPSTETVASDAECDRGSSCRDEGEPEGREGVDRSRHRAQRAGLDGGRQGCRGHAGTGRLGPGAGRRAGAGR